MLLHSPEQRLQDVPFTFEQIVGILNSNHRFYLVFHVEYLPLTFYPGFLLVRKMLCPRPDYHIYIVHTENLRKQPEL